MVPFFYLLMAVPEWSGVEAAPESRAAVAHATSLLVIVPTAVSGALAWRRAGLLKLEGLGLLALGATLAAVPGARLASQLPDAQLRIVFALFLLVTAVRLVSPSRVKSPDTASEAPRRSHPAVELAGGGAIGLTSAILGVGGGIVAVPILIRWFGVDVREVAARSVVIIACAAPAGVASYMWAGRALEGLPAGSTGFVSWPLALALVPGAVLMAPVGARLNQKLSTRALRTIFALLMAGVGLRLLWGHLPMAG